LSAGVPVRPRINPQQGSNFDFERDFLARFAHCGLLHGFAQLDETAGDRPSRREILALDKHYAIANFDD